MLLTLPVLPMRGKSWADRGPRVASQTAQKDLSRAHPPFLGIQSRQIGYAVLINGRTTGLEYHGGSPRALGSSSLDVKREHDKDLRLRGITRCKVAPADTKSSRAASACRESLTVVQEKTHSVLKQILLMQVALDLSVQGMVVADSFTLVWANAERIWPHGLASRARRTRNRRGGRVHSNAG